MKTKIAKGTKISIGYNPDGRGWLWAGTGIWDGNTCVCTAEIPSEIYDTIDEGIRRGVMSDTLTYRDSTTVYSYQVAD